MKIKITITLLLIALGSYIYMTVRSNHTSLSEQCGLLKENIEALSQTESGSGHYK